MTLMTQMTVLLVDAFKWTQFYWSGSILIDGQPNLNSYFADLVFLISRR